MAEKAPAFQWYPKDIMGSKRVALMSLAEEGAYRRALDYCWLHETLPANTKELAMLIGKNCSVKIAEAVKKMFVEVSGELRHERLDKEREKQKNYSESQSNNGKQGGRGNKKHRQEESETKAEKKPPLLNGLSETKAEKSSAFASSSAFPSSELNTNTLSPAGEVFDLKYFKEQGFSWNIESYLLAGALNEYLVYRCGEPWRSPIKSYQSVEAILKELGKYPVTDAIEMLEHTIRKQAKNVIYELPKEVKSGNPVQKSESLEKTKSSWAT